MSMIITALLLIVHYVSGQAATPTLWGSRVVSTASGPSDEMVFDATSNTVLILVFRDGVELTPVTIDNETNQCMIGTEVFGDLCKFDMVDADKFTLTIKATDVTKQVAFSIQNTYGPLLAYFAPNCKFPVIKSGQVDLVTSLPFSRFVGSKTEVELNFAVHGLNTEVQLFRNGFPMCNYVGGVAQTQPNNDPCPKLVKDELTDMQKLTINVTKQARKADRETFVWGNNLSDYAVSVSVDWIQDGVHEECKSSIPTTTEATTFGVIYEMGVNIGLLAVLLYFRK